MNLERCGQTLLDQIRAFEIFDLFEKLLGDVETALDQFPSEQETIYWGLREALKTFLLSEFERHSHVLVEVLQYGLHCRFPETGGSSRREAFGRVVKEEVARAKQVFLARPYSQRFSQKLG